MKNENSVWFEGQEVYFNSEIRKSLKKWSRINTLVTTIQTKIEASPSGTVNNIVNRQLTDFIANSMVDRIHSFKNCWGTHKHSIFKRINQMIFEKSPWNVYWQFNCNWTNFSLISSQVIILKKLMIYLHLNHLRVFLLVNAGVNIPLLFLTQFICLSLKVSK
jgi:hypothetical protein